MESIQESVVGRRLAGHGDELLGFQLSSLPITDPEAAAALGMTHYANVAETGREADRVKGTAYEVSDAELFAMDEYEQDAGYQRRVVRLASGTEAWVYEAKPIGQ